MNGYRVAVVGATGLVGREFIRVLEQRNFPIASIQFLASDRSAGKKLFFSHREIEVKETVPESFKDIDIALSSAGAEVSRYFSPLAAQSGAVVVDNSSAYRMDPRVPLVVPEINPEDIGRHKGIVANPNCSTIQMVVALYPLHKVNPIRRIVVTTFQSVSGTGAAAVEELTLQARQVLDGQATGPHIYPHQIAFNVLPEIDVFLDNAYTKEEWKMAEETRKIMHADDIAISATCVRVPVFIGHSEAVSVELSEAMSPDEARRILAQAPGVKLLDDPAISLYPQPWSAVGTDEVFVGRIRRDTSHPNGLVMWVVADNLRKGAALNAVQIAEEMVKRDLVHRGGVEMKELGRLITAMVTPFAEDGSVSYEQARRLALSLLGSGSEGLVVVGTTGESPTLVREEELKLFAEIKSAVGEQGAVIAGTGSNSTAEALEATREAEKTGVDACLLVVPYYNKPTQEGLYRHFKTIAEGTSLPCILYNVPSRTVVSLSAETVVRLSRVENIIGVKEASGNLSEIARIIDNTGDDFIVWSGNDSDTLPILALGGYGVISVASHLVGNQIGEMIKSFTGGRTDRAAEIHRHLMPLFNALFVIANPIPLKYALNHIGFRVGKPRLPLIEPDEKTAALVRETLKNYHIDLAV